MRFVMNLSLILFLLAVGLGVGGAYQGQVRGGLVYYLLLIAVGTGALAFLFAVMLAVFRPTSGKSRYFEMPVTGYLSLLIGFALIGGGAYFYVMYYQKYPLINDVTTDTKDPPEFRGPVMETYAKEGMELVEDSVAPPRIYDPTFANLQRAKYPDVLPLKLKAPPSVSYQAALIAARTVPNWRIVHEEPEKFHFEAVAETEFFHFQDDIAVEIRADIDPKAGLEGEPQSVLHVRSRSRVGRFDFGMNARRVQQFAAKVKSTLPRVLRREQAKQKQEAAAAGQAGSAADAADTQQQPDASATGKAR